MAATMMSSVSIARPSTCVPSVRRNARTVRSASRMVVRAESDNNKFVDPDTPLVGPKGELVRDGEASKVVKCYACGRKNSPRCRSAASRAAPIRQDARLLALYPSR